MAQWEKKIKALFIHTNQWAFNPNWIILISDSICNYASVRLSLSPSTSMNFFSCKLCNDISNSWTVCEAPQKQTYLPFGQKSSDPKPGSKNTECLTGFLDVGHPSRRERPRVTQQCLYVGLLRGCRWKRCFEESPHPLEEYNRAPPWHN